MYTTPEAVQLVLARNRDEYPGTAASLSTPQLEDAIRSAESEVNSRMSLQYKVPFAETPQTPPLIAEITRDIACFLADLNFRQDTDYTSDNEPMLLRYRRAQELLGMLVEGTISLTGVETNDPPDRSENTAVSFNKYSGQLFSLSDFDLGLCSEARRYPLYPERTDYF